ncbi:hypothetical protein [Candidatus Symbiopectobacterium sp.]|uniref:hypothetical protein n=1 Tax=Candidatus Symbiopectobacterium sp. TaxID=2816440 RepID=UPI0025B8A28D|nr:hypothetical protein [Candidatus Symbiopectobacterium sp.]
MRGSVFSLGCQHKIYLFNKAAKDYDTEYDSEMSLCESEPEPESKDRPTTSKAIGERGKEKRT